MPISAVDARQVQGRFDNTLRGQQPPSQDAKRAAHWPLAQRFRISNRPADLLTLACLLGSALPARSAGPVGRHLPAGHPTPSSVPTTSSALTSSALLPGSAAVQNSRTVTGTAPGSSLTMALSNIANVAATACVASPRTCLTGAGLVTMGAIATTVGDTLFSSRQTLPRTLSPTSLAAPPSLDAATAARLHEGFRQIQVIAPDTGATQSLEHGFINASAACSGDTACLRDAAARLLQGLSPADQRRLADLVGNRTEGNSAASSPLPGVQAHPLFGPRMLDDLAALLTQLYPADEARYMQDIEHIVQATCGDPLPDGTSCQQRAGDNASRMDMIQRLLEATGLPTRVLPYQLEERRAKLLNIPRDAHNLLATIRSPAAGPGSPRRVLMLVAHGDMIGMNSAGAYDNASGVACLLHIARTLPADSLPPDTAVQLLVTSHEETGLHGASAFVKQCKAASSCPTLSVAVDLVGRGANGYVMSGSDTIDRFSPDVPFDQSATPGIISAEEAAGARLLQDTFAAHGFIRHLTGEAFVVQSDNVPFQRQGLPALGIFQISEDDARRDKGIQDSDVTFRKAFDAVDWALLDTLSLRNDTLSPQEQQQLDAQLDAVDALNAAEDAGARLYAALPAGSMFNVIHGPNDQTRMVSASEAVEFGTALRAFVQQWMGS